MDDPTENDATKGGFPSGDTRIWLNGFAEMMGDSGLIETLGKHHWAVFSERCPMLLITFEGLDDIRSDHPTQLPLGYRVAQAKGWSHLCIIADGPTWWRDDAVYDYFDRLIDSEFLERFDRVAFFGASDGGYAAAAFSVAAPGSTVLALQPVATLNPDQAGWDRRFLESRRLNFSGRYGYAPDMVEGAEQVFLVFDPTQPEDAMHAALFHGPQITKLRCTYLGERTDFGLGSMGLLTSLIEEVCEDHLTPPVFARLWRARRRHRPYLSELIAINRKRGKLDRAIRVCRFAAETLNDLRFKRRLDELEKERA
jgi:hypothetical protein